MLPRSCFTTTCQPGSLASTRCGSTDVAASAAAEPHRPPTTQEIIQRKVIRNGDIEFEVDNFDSATLTVTKIVVEEGGYIATTNSEKLPNGKVKGTPVLPCVRLGRKRGVIEATLEEYLKNSETDGSGKWIENGGGRRRHNVSKIKKQLKTVAWRRWWSATTGCAVRSLGQRPIGTQRARSIDHVHSR